MSTALAPIDKFRSGLVEQKKALVNLCGSEKAALRFMSSAVMAVQKTPKLLECDQQSLIASFSTIAQFQFMPGGIGGEAYVIPRRGKAVFQLGYQGIITLLYRAGCRDIVVEVVRENDEFTYENGQVHHRVDHFSDRGDWKGAYAIITLARGGKISKVMSRADIMEIAKMSDSFGSSFSPWKSGSDPQLWMPRKTVLIQCSKLAPKSDELLRALDEDYQDSVITRREEESKRLREGITTASNDESDGGNVAKSLTMGAVAKKAAAPTPKKTPMTPKAHAQEEEAIDIEQAEIADEDILDIGEEAQ